MHGLGFRVYDRDFAPGGFLREVVQTYERHVREISGEWLVMGSLRYRSPSLWLMGETRA